LSSFTHVVAPAFEVTFLEACFTFTVTLFWPHYFSSLTESSLSLPLSLNISSGHLINAGRIRSSPRYFFAQWELWACNMLNWWPGCWLKIASLLRSTKGLSLDWDVIISEIIPNTCLTSENTDAQ
jgi:hypothetical protein